MVEARSLPAVVRSRRVSWLTALCLFFALVFAALGTWQMQRLSWKRDLIERVQQRLSSPPKSLAAPDQWAAMGGADAEYSAVTVRGQWLSAQTLLSQALTSYGAGYWVMTPLQQADGSQVLVNRGFVPSTARAAWLPEAARAHDARLPSEVVVTGLLRRNEPGGGFLRTNDAAQQRWHSRDVVAMAQALDLSRAAPFFIDAGLPSLPASGGGRTGDLDGATLAVQQAEPVEGLTVVRFANNHLVYACTWYGLAILCIAAFLRVARYAPAPVKETNAPHDVPPSN